MLLLRLARLLIWCGICQTVGESCVIACVQVDCIHLKNLCWREEEKKSKKKSDESRYGQEIIIKKSYTRKEDGTNRWNLCSQQNENCVTKDRSLIVPTSITRDFPASCRNNTIGRMKLYCSKCGTSGENRRWSSERRKISFSSHSRELDLSSIFGYYIEWEEKTRAAAKPPPRTMSLQLLSWAYFIINYSMFDRLKMLFWLKNFPEPSIRAAAAAFMHTAEDRRRHRGLCNDDIAQAEHP